MLVETNGGTHILIWLIEKQITRLLVYAAMRNSHLTEMPRENIVVTSVIQNIDLEVNKLSENKIKWLNFSDYTNKL